MTSPDTLKALAADLREIESSTIFNNKGDGNSITQAAALLESLASADEGVPVVAYTKDGEGGHAPILTFDASRFLDRDSFKALVLQSDHLAALSAQSTAADEMAVALKAVCNYLSGSQTRDIGTDQAALSEVRAALAAHEAKHGGKG